jgi:hypothetical protein
MVCTRVYLKQQDKSDPTHKLLLFRGVGAMKAIAAFEWGHVRTGIAHERNRAQVWKDMGKTAQKATAKIVEAAIVVLVAAVFITAVMRVNECYRATAYFNETIAKTVLAGADLN